MDLKAAEIIRSHPQSATFTQRRRKDVYSQRSDRFSQPVWRTGLLAGLMGKDGLKKGADWTLITIYDPAFDGQNQWQEIKD